jgi:hypothetical protein
MATNNASNNTYYRTTIAFSARISSDNANMTGDGTVVSPVVFDTCDYGSGYYNNATGLYSAPMVVIIYRLIIILAKRYGLMNIGIRGLRITSYLYHALAQHIWMQEKQRLSFI